MSSIPEPGGLQSRDLLDECARVRPGQEVLIVAYRDGLRGGDNLVDEQAIAWIEAGVKDREPMRPCCGRTSDRPCTSGDSRPSSGPPWLPAT